jgi:hypothetical protein
MVWININFMCYIYIYICIYIYLFYNFWFLYGAPVEVNLEGLYWLLWAVFLNVLAFLLATVLMFLG